MAKERKSNKEGKKKAALTPKEKKAAKKAKKDRVIGALRNHLPYNAFRWLVASNNSLSAG